MRAGSGIGSLGGAGGGSPQTLKEVLVVARKV